MAYAKQGRPFRAISAPSAPGLLPCWQVAVDIGSTCLVFCPARAHAAARAAVRSAQGEAVFPLRDDNPTILTPHVTVLLILANVVVWIYVQGAGVMEAVLMEAVCRFGLIPAGLTGLVDADAAGRLAAAGEACAVREGAWETLVTSMFLHGGWLHLIANMWFLWLFGNNIEDRLGHIRYLVFYLTAGLAAAGAHIYMEPDSVLPLVGASGAVSGLMGAYLVLYPKVRIQTLFIIVFIIRVIPVPAWLVLILWFAIQLVSAYASPAATGGIAFWAHAGGFVAGVLLVKLFENRSLAERRRQLGDPYAGIDRS
jgi:membrane associated rhomboid family serine protease